MTNTTARAEQLDMLAQIEIAAATASTATMPRRAAGLTGESLANARDAHCTQSGFVTLRTSRGVFRVRNTRERLAEVARKMRAPGAFGRGRKLPIGRDGDGSHRAARRMDRAPGAILLTEAEILEKIAGAKRMAMTAMQHSWRLAAGLGCKTGLVLLAEEIDGLQRELVARGLLDATDLDKVTAEPLDESDSAPVQAIESTPPVPTIEAEPTPPVPALQVGRRARYRGWGPGRMDSGPGIVVAVSGGVHGAMLEVVTLQDGKRRTFRELDTLGPDPVLVLENAMASDVETSRAARLAAETQAGADAEKSLAAVRREVEVERLRAEHPHLLPASDRRAVGHNLRALLKAAGIRASVRKADASCYRVTLPSGSTDAQLAQASEICGRFRAGHFDGMTDSYEYTRSAWTDAFGGVRFVFTQRDWRDADQDAPSPPTAAPPPATLDDSTLPVPAIDSTLPVPADDSTPPVPASVTHLAAWRAKQARQREICGTTPARAAQNPRTRLRFDHASGEWMAVYRWHG